MFSLMFALASAHGQSTLFLSTYDFLRLTGTERRAYVESTRTVFAEFERRYNEAHPGVVSLDLLPRAEAETDQYCPVGGVFIRRRGGRCSTYGRNCGGKADGFLCGKLYRNACVDRQPVDSLSARCHESAPPDLTAEEYANFSSVVDRGYAQACASARPAPACGFIKDRMKSINDHLRRPEPEPPPPAPAPPNDAQAGKFSAVKDGACRRDRNQGRWGTCHAFCLTCVYDNAMANATGKTDFKVSSNWIAMLSVVKRVCDDPDSRDLLSDDLLKKGWFADQNLNSLAAFGACAESSFPPYKGVEDWASQLRLASAGRAPLKVGANRGLNPQMQYSEEERRKWRELFAIEPQQAFDLFCPGDRKLEDSTGGYAVRLARDKEKLDPKFVKCAEEGLRNKSRIRLPETTSASCDTKIVEPGGQGVADLKRLIHEANGPIPAVIRTSYPGHPLHCVTLTGYDDVKKVFTAINSWGENETFDELPYDQQTSRLMFTTTADCAIVSNRRQAAPGGGPARATR